MITYTTSSQLIIGLKSYRQIIRLVQEHHFKKVALCYVKDYLQEIPKTITYLFKKIRSNVCKPLIVSLRIDNVNNSIDSDTDLVISYGSRIGHDIVKSLINQNTTLYCIESRPIWISSYGTGIFWNRDRASWKKIIPNLIFNDCDPKHQWDIYDLIYFLHAFPLALDASLISEPNNEFIQDCAFQGILSFLKSYQELKSVKTKRHIKQIYIDLAHADVLLKNAYNNTKFSNETNKIALSVQHYRQFEVATCFESLDVFHNHLNVYHKQLTKILNEYGVTIEQFQKDIENVYYDFLNHPQRQEAIYEIIGSNLKKILIQNQKTRRVI